jgi:hypothetical protein
MRAVVRTRDLPRQVRLPQEAEAAAFEDGGRAFEVVGVDGEKRAAAGADEEGVAEEDIELGLSRSKQAAVRGNGRQGLTSGFAGSLSAPGFDPESFSTT